MSTHLAIGRRLLGKTTLVYSMARRSPYRVIVDPRGLIHTGAVRVRSGEALDRAFDLMADQVPLLADGSLAPEGETGHPLREILITPENDLQEMFSATCQLVKHWSVRYEGHHTDRGLSFVVDEARFFELMKAPAFEYLLRAAPPELIDILITAHQPKDLPTAIRAIADRWCIFRITQPTDLDAIREKCGDDVAKQVAQLAPHQFIEWNDATGTARAYRDPRVWFTPLRSDNAKPLEILPDPGEDSQLDREKLPGF